MIKYVWSTWSVNWLFLLSDIKRMTRLVIIKCNLYQQAFQMLDLFKTHMYSCFGTCFNQNFSMFFCLKLSQSCKIYVQPQGKLYRMNILAWCCASLTRHWSVALISFDIFPSIIMLSAVQSCICSCHWPPCHVGQPESLFHVVSHH